MARSARYAGGQAALTRLLGPFLGGAVVGLAGACASMQAPPGAPFDPDPPILLSATPDSGTVVAGFDDVVEFQFDEVIAEQGLERLVTISPRHDELRVSWKRRRFTVKPRDGWHSNAVYQVTLLPGVSDLQNNQTEERTTIVFSTGGNIPDTRITGSVADWEGGRMARNALVEAVRLPDSLTYVGLTDSLGMFELFFLPSGTYLLRAGIDGNNNQRLDRREPYDSATVVFADSLLTRDFWTFRHDTVGPRVSDLILVDSQSVAIEFNQMLGLTFPATDAFAVWELPDSNRVPVSRVLLRAEFDSLRQAAADSVAAVAAAAADSLRAALADSLGVTPDSAGAPIDSAPPAPADTLVADTTLGAVPADSLAAAAEADSTRTALFLAQRPTLFSEIVITTVEPLEPGTRYWVEATVSNLLGAALQSGRFLTVPAVAEPDST